MAFSSVPTPNSPKPELYEHPPKPSSRKEQTGRRSTEPATEDIQMLPIQMTFECILSRELWPLTRFPLTLSLSSLSCHPALSSPSPFPLPSSLSSSYPSIPSARAPLSLHSHRLRLQVTGCRRGVCIIGAFIESMAEGLSVHYNPLEDHIVGFLMSRKEDVVNGQPHTGAITAHASIHAQIQQTLTEIRQILARIERKNNAQHPSPPEHSPPLQVSSSITAPFSDLRSPVTEIPYFSSQNVSSWLCHIEQFFWKHQTPSE